MASSTGFKIHFIDKSLPVPFPDFSKLQLKDLALFDSQKTGELKYPHFSIFLSATRKFPFFTATNIDGKKFIKIKRDDIFESGNDEWNYDDRAKAFQWGPTLYSAKKSDFHRGHMTKREDPQWGNTKKEALAAARATFYYSNCVPQLGELNSKDWGKLESYILSKVCIPEMLRINVFTGPVLADEDPFFVTKVENKNIQLPTLFWKVVYYTENGKDLSCAAFLMGQETKLFEKGIVQRKHRPLAKRMKLRDRLFQDFEESALYQVSIKTLEALTNLKFPSAIEPYQEEHPLKLIIKRVQISAKEAKKTILSSDEDKNEKVEFSNIHLQVANTKTFQLSRNKTKFYSPASAPIFSGQKSVGTLYTREMKRRFGYHATWNPGTPLKLGDIGILENDQFIRLTDLESLSLVSVIQETKGSPVELKYHSKGGIMITTKLAGAASLPNSTLTKADAGVLIQFEKDNSICFQANDCITSLMKDTTKLGKEILKRFEQGKWDKNWVIITELITAASATILIAERAGASIELKANAKITATKLDIADTSFKFSASYSNQLDTEIIAQKGLTPLFKVMGIQSKLLGKPGFKPKANPIQILTPSDLTDNKKRNQIEFGYIGTTDHSKSL